VSAGPPWSRTMKQASVSSTDQGGGKRGAARAGYGTAPVGNRHAQCGDCVAFSFFLAS
jgi:hypothetical protein